MDDKELEQFFDGIILTDIFKEIEYQQKYIGVFMPIKFDENIKRNIKRNINRN